MLGFGFTIGVLALRRASAPPPVSRTVDRTTTTVDSTIRTVDRA
jgi:hypothetical protein